MSLLRIIFLGIQLWIRSFLPVLGVVVILFTLFETLRVEIGEVWEILIILAVYFPLSSMLIDYSFKKIAYKKHNLEFKKFVGWGIVWRTSLLMAIIGGVLSLIPRYSQFNMVGRSLLPVMFSIPILGLIANYFLVKQIHMAKTINANQSIYDKQIYRLARISFVLSVIWLGGVGSLIAIILARRALRLMKKYDTKVVGGWLAKFGYIAGWIGLCWWGGIIVLVILNILKSLHF
jgi:uncharacterized membrane protein